MQSFILLPWGMVNLLNGPAPSLTSLAIMFVFSFFSVFNFYSDSVAKQRIDSAHLAIFFTFSTILTALGVSVYLEYHTSLITHKLSVGVVLACLLLLLATVFLTHSSQSTQGLLIGYSAAGLPLYSSQQAPPTSFNWIKPLVGQILDNPDSRRIFYFLILNLVR